MNYYFFLLFSCTSVWSVNWRAGERVHGLGERRLPLGNHSPLRSTSPSAPVVGRTCDEWCGCVGGALHSHPAKSPQPLSQAGGVRVEKRHLTHTGLTCNLVQKVTLAFEAYLKPGSKIVSIVAYWSLYVVANCFLFFLSHTFIFLYLNLVILLLAHFLS